MAQPRRGAGFRRLTAASRAVCFNRLRWRGGIGRRSRLRRSHPRHMRTQAIALGCALSVLSGCTRQGKLLPAAMTESTGNVDPREISTWPITKVKAIAFACEPPWYRRFRVLACGGPGLAPAWEVQHGRVSEAGWSVAWSLIIDGETGEVISSRRTPHTNELMRTLGLKQTRLRRARAKAAREGKDE